jgi:hypothetical protein
MTPTQDEADKTDWLENPYIDPLTRLLAEAKEIREAETQLAIRKARVNAAINALWPLAFPETVNINTLGLANAIRVVFGGTDRPLTAIEVRGKLEDLGFDLSQFSNALASIHTATRRMIESEELIDVPSDDNKKKVGAGPELKAVPEMAADTTSGLLSRMSGG